MTWKGFHLLSTFLISLGGSAYGDDASGHIEHGKLQLRVTEDQAVGVAISQNLELLAGKYSISIAEAQELAAGAWNNPVLFVDSQLMPFGPNWNQTTAGGPTQRDIMVTQPLDLSGKIGLSVESAKEATRAQEASFQDDVRQKSLEVRLAYIDLLLDAEQLWLVQEKLESTEHLIQLVKGRIGSPKLLPLLQTRSQLALERTELEKKTLEGEFEQDKREFSALLGKIPQEATIVPTEKLRDFNRVYSPNLGELIDRALEKRPDLKALNLLSSKSKIDHKLERARIWDNVSVAGGVSNQVGVGAMPGVSGSRELPGAWSWLVGITIPLPVLSQNRGNIRAALLAGEQAEKRIDALRLTIRVEVQTGQDKLKRLADQLHVYEERVLKQARLVRDSAQRQFGTGSTTLLEYLDAIEAYYGTVGAYLDTLTNFRKTKAQLSAAVATRIDP